MPGILVNGIKTLIHDQKLAHAPFTNLKFGLFTGILVPSSVTVIGDITEVTGTGYSQQTITGWSAAALLGTGVSFSQAGIVTFANTGIADWDEATGWFWRYVTSNLLVAAQRFTLPFTLTPGTTWPFAPTDLFTGG